MVLLTTLRALNDGACQRPMCNRDLFAVMWPAPAQQSMDDATNSNNISSSSSSKIQLWLERTDIIDIHRNPDVITSIVVILPQEQ